MTKSVGSEDSQCRAAMNLRNKLGFWGVILCLALWIAFQYAFREHNESAIEKRVVTVESNSPGRITEFAPKAPSPDRFASRNDIPRSSTVRPPIGADSTESELEQELAESRLRLAAIEQQAYLANPYLKVWEDYRNVPTNWADNDESARAARLFVRKEKAVSEIELSNLMLPLLIVKIDSVDPQFRDLLSGTFSFFAKDHMRLLKAAIDQEIPVTLDEYLLKVKKLAPIQNEAIERLRVEFGMSPEILEGFERREMSRLLTGLVDLYLGVHTPQELGEAREAVRRAEILLGRKQTKPTSQP